MLLQYMLCFDSPRLCDSRFKGPAVNIDAVESFRIFFRGLVTTLEVQALDCRKSNSQVIEVLIEAPIK